MIIVLNGSLGVGKTSTAWALQEFVQPSFMLDGDYIGAVKPREIYDQNRVDYLYQTIAHLMDFHIQNGYQHFIINYVFESGAILQALIDKLQKFEMPIHTFRLVCEAEEHQKRVLSRGSDQIEWELSRSRQLNQILEDNDVDDALGVRIDTTALGVNEVASVIWNLITS